MTSNVCLLVMIAAWPFLNAVELRASPQDAEAENPLGLQKVQFIARLSSQINTQNAGKGDLVSASVTSPDAYRDAQLEGKIQETKPAKKSQKAEISFAFTTLIVGGKRHSIEADLEEVSNSKGVKNVDEEGRVIGKSSMKKKLAGTAAGAGIGAALGAIKGGGKGAGIGAAAGAGAGLLLTIALTTSGSDIEFAPGSLFTLTVSDRPR